MQRNSITGNKELFVSKKNGSALARIFENNNTVKTKVEAEANAKIMAAAPELLAQLEYAKDYINCLHGNHQPVIDLLINTIKKATE